MSNSVGGIGGPQEINPLNNRKGADRSSKSGSKDSEGREDRVEISREGNLKAYLVDLKSAPEIRHDRVERIKAEIDSGVYVTEEKLNRAVDSLMDDLF